MDTKRSPFFSKTLFLILYLVMRIQLTIYAQDVGGKAAVVRLFRAEGQIWAKNIGAYFNIPAANFAEMFKIKDIFE
jgi:hypothetical protein